MFLMEKIMVLDCYLPPLLTIPIPVVSLSHKGDAQEDTTHNISLYNRGSDKVSMLTHTYPHKPLRKIKATICNHQPDSPPNVGLMSD